MTRQAKWLEYVLGAMVTGSMAAGMAATRGRTSDAARAGVFLSRLQR